MPRIEINEVQCKGCGLCVIACPRQIITLQQDKLNSRGFHPAAVKDMRRCTGCAFCATICPDTVIEVWREVRKS